MRRKPPVQREVPKVTEPLLVQPPPLLAQGRFPALAGG